MGRYFVIALFIIFVSIVSIGIINFFKNQNSPVINTRAYVSDKKRYSHTDTNNIIHTDYYIIFTLDSNDVIKFCVPGRIYRQLECGYNGILTFQGKKFLKFQSGEIIAEK